ncbi:MAG TPA: MSEP-CTERM sorting domain-containing protein, partial [Chthoniobacterales bacterium]
FSPNIASFPNPFSRIHSSIISSLLVSFFLLVISLFSYDPNTKFRTGSWMVFKGLVLPDAKISQLHQIFAGKPMPQGGSGLFSGVGSRRNQPAPQAIRRPATAVLKDVHWSTTINAEGSQSTVAEVTVHNPTSDVAEFVAPIAVPDGAFISGYSLRIGDRDVPGKLFERKTAMWVYEKIRNVLVAPRDPGVLTFVSPGKAELRVFPINAGESRTTKVEFLSTAKRRPQIVVAGKSLGAESASGTATWAATSWGGMLQLPFSNTELPKTTRVPYVHLIFDTSADGVEPDAAVKRVREILDEFPGLARIAAGLANIEYQEVTQTPLAVSSEFEASLRANLMKCSKNSGFDLNRALKTVLLEYSQRVDQTWKPVVVVVRAKPYNGTEKPDLTGFDSLVPDAPYYFETSTESRSELKRVAFSESDPSSESPVFLLRAGSIVRASSSERGGVVWFDGASANDNALEIYDPAVERFTALPRSLIRDASEKEVAAAGAWLQHREGLFHPERLAAGFGKLVDVGRATGILLPELAYMVVETKAQWEMLDRQQDKKLKANNVMELEEPAAIPEPETWALLATAVLIMCAWQWRKRIILTKWLDS